MTVSDSDLFPALRHRLGYAAFLGLEGLLRCLPAAAGRPLGRRLGLGEAICDLLAAGRLDEVGFCRRLTLEGWEHLNDAEARGRGVVLVGAGTGGWELAALAVGLYRGPMDVLDRPLDNPLLARRLGRLRTRFGNRLVAAGEAPVRMLEILLRRGRVGLPLDSRPGTPTATDAAKLAARLARDAGAPIVPASCRPADRDRHRIVIGPAISAGNNGEQEEDAEWLSQRLTAAIEEIRRRSER